MSAQSFLIKSATEHAELGRDYLRAGMPGFALGHLRTAVERLEQAAAGTPEEVKIEAGKTGEQGLIEL